MKDPADHRGALGDLYDDLQLYREVEFSLDHTVWAALIAGRRTCANQQLADPTPAQEQATGNLVRALSAWQEAQVAEEEKQADPPPPSELKSELKAALENEIALRRHRPEH